MPADGDCPDVQEGCDRRRVESLELIHHNDGPAARRQVVECLPHDGVDHERAFGMIVLGDDGFQQGVVALPDAFLSPLITADVYQDADQPRLFIRHAAWNGFRRPGGLEERLLNEVEGIIDRRGQTPCQPIEPLLVRIEERRQSRCVLCAHTSLNA